MEIICDILNKQPRTADKGWSSSLGRLDEGLTTPQNHLVTKFYSGPWTWASGRLLMKLQGS